MLLGVFGALGLAGGVGSAQEGNSLASSSPEDGATVASSPERIVLEFDSEIGDANLVTVACNSDPFTGIGTPTVSDDGRTLSVDVVTPMPRGSCTVGWGVSQPSGEPGITGDFTFTVQSGPPGSSVPEGTTPGSATTVPGEASGDSGGPVDQVAEADEVSDGPIWLGRVISTLGLAVLFGSFVLIVAAWPEGPEYILAVRFLRSVWMLTLVGTLLFVVALTAAVNDESFSAGLNPAAWLDLLDAGWSGRAALARLVLVLATGWVVLRPERVIDPTSQMLALGIPALAVATIGLSRTGGELAVVGIAAGITHALAMAVWFGAVVLLARVVLAGPGEEDLVHAVRGFTRISTPAIVITVLSGLVQVYRLDGGALFTTNHGRVMLVKTAVVALMVFIGLTARQVAQARLARAADLAAPAADRLRRAFGTEAVIGVIVLGLSGWLLGLTPNKAPVEAGGDFAIERTFRDTEAGLDLTVSLRPGRVGLNEMRVEVREPEEGVTGLTVTLFPPAGSTEPRIEQPIPLSGAGIALSGEGGGVPLNVAGSWRMQVAASTQTGAVPAAENSFVVNEADGSEPTTELVPPVTGAATTVPPLGTGDPLAPATTTGG